MMAIFSFAFLFTGPDLSAQCIYDLDQLTYTENSTSLYIYPWGGVSGEFLVLWREKGTGPGWNNTGLTSSHVAIISDLEECTKYEFCILEKCGPGDWSTEETTEIVCVMTLCDCPCDEPITISPEAGAHTTSAWVYANGYVGIDHYFEYWAVDSPGSTMTTTIQTGHATLLEDLDPCRKYAYRLIVFCPEYEECPDACEVQGGAEVSETHYFMTMGCHEDGGKCCDYLFMVDKSGSMTQEELAEIECQIEATIDSIQMECGCESGFAVSTWQDDHEDSNVLNDFECDPTIDLGGPTGGGTDIGNATGDAADWLEDGSLNTDNECLNVIIFTDTGCRDYDEEFTQGVQDLLDAGASSVSVVSIGNHGCEEVLEPIENANGTYTEIDPGDCTEGLLGNDSETRSSSAKRIYIFDDKNPDLLLRIIEPGAQINSNTLNVYPMPFSDVINIDYNLDTQSDITIEIYNTFGTVVHKESRTNSPKGANTISIENTLPQGTYTYQINFGKQTHSGTMLKI